MTVVVDNCLPVSWMSYLQRRGFPTRHRRELGPPNAPDSDIMLWARTHGAVVLTHDLDFTKLLFETQAALPSVIQLRVDDVRPVAVGENVILILTQHEAELLGGALITVKGHKARLRLLPLVD